MKKILAAIRARLSAPALAMAALALFVAVSMIGQAHAMRTRATSPFTSTTPKTGITPFYSTAQDSTDWNALSIVINVTALAASPTPALTISIEHSADNSVWATHTTLTVITATGTYESHISNFSRYWRVKALLGAATGITGTFTMKAYEKEFTKAPQLGRPMIDLAFHMDEAARYLVSESVDSSIYGAPGSIVVASVPQGSQDTR